MNKLNLDFMHTLTGNYLLYYTLTLSSDISLQCICVDTAHVAVSPAEVVNQAPSQVCMQLFKL